MLTQLFHTGLQLLAMVGIVCILWGAFAIVGVLAANRGPFDMIKGGAFIALGVYLIGLGHGI